MNLKEYEEIFVSLSPLNVRFSQLAKILYELGFKRTGFSEGDVFYMLRSDQVEKCQTDTLINVYTFSDGQELFYFKNEDPVIDEVQLGYLLASMPIENLESFIHQVWRLANRLNSQVHYSGSAISATKLTAVIQSYADELTKSVDQPGSFKLHKAISKLYPLP
ncbi:hypothetical protein ACFODZ_16070 [Marinicella sediminis]|uniref:DUF4304 domain-containing protein n=1 Tax=Marinicella sediminis TaxID=1792834 RepID=A0ABV7JHQ9_9GAMM|nr:hypothetical protein [Marinicella sediminis]